MAVFAIHYVKVAGKLYEPGDLISYDFPQADIKYLLSKGAVRVEEDTEVLEADYNGPEIVFKPAEEVENPEPEDPKSIDADDGIVIPAKKKATRKKG